MIFLVSKQETLFESERYEIMSVEASLKEISTWDIVQYDCETSGRNPHLCEVLSAQFGNKARNIQIVVDCATIDLALYKEILETKLLVGHNLKFDTQFLFKYNIVPTKIWDTMIIEQLLHLGYNPKYFHYSLHNVAERRLGIDIDKTVRGEIIWRGLDEQVIIYAAGDVVYLEDIKAQQETECKQKTCQIAAQLENAFVPVIAYLEWCGIKLDVDKWKAKIASDKAKRDSYLEKLNNWLVKSAEENEDLKKFTSYDEFGLFTNIWDEVATINWNSAEQVIELCNVLGFDTKVEDKETGEDKDSVMMKSLIKQKGVNDEFLENYVNYKEASKVCSTYNETYIYAINPKTGRIHTKFKQLGASSGRMSCGGGNKDFDTDLARFKHLADNKCKFVQLQNLPADEATRSSFICEPGNLMCSCDYSALESRLGADIYNEPAMIEEYLHGSGDIHSLTAKACFPKELAGIEVKDIKKFRPDLRSKAKPVEFSQQFGGSAKAIQGSLGCSYQEAKEIATAYNNGFKGIATFKAKGSQFTRTHGYVIICKYTGHKIYWEDFEKWQKIERMPEYIKQCECTPEEIREHNMAASKWDRLVLNSPTQGTGIICLKLAMVMFFNWILKNNYFNKVLLCDLVHDEAVIEAPKEIADETFKQLKFFMEKATATLCKKLPIPAEPAIGDHWIH